MPVCDCTTFKEYDILLGVFSNVILPDIYCIGFFKLLYDVHLGVSVFRRSWLMRYVAWKTLILFLRGRKTDEEQFRTLRTPLLQVCNSWLAVLEKKHPDPGLHTHCAKQKTSLHINCLFRKGGICSMRERKDFRSVDIIFLFVWASMDGRSGHRENGYLKIINTRYFDILSRISDEFGQSRWMDKDFNHLDNDIKYFKTQLSKLFGPQCPMCYIRWNSILSVASVKICAILASLS